MVHITQLIMSLLALLSLSDLMANQLHRSEYTDNMPRTTILSTFDNPQYSMPDLTLEDLELPTTTVSQGQILSFNFIVSNIGTLSTGDTGSFTIKPYISTDQNLSTDDFQDGVIPAGNFFYALSMPGTGVITIPEDFPPGTYYIILQIDADEEIAESDENNNIITSSNFTIQATENNNDCPIAINGFTALGEYQGHKYFLSNSNASWVNASTTAAANGGYLASINSAGENEFIRSMLGNNIVFIGYNDAQTEGNLQWNSGEQVTYTNLEGGNSPDGDFAYINFWAGSWTLTNQLVQKPYILEVVCDNGNTGETACSFRESYPLPPEYNNLLDGTTIEETDDGYQLRHTQDIGTDAFYFETFDIASDGSLQGEHHIILPTDNMSRYGDFGYSVSSSQEANTIQLSAIGITDTLWSNSLFLGDTITGIIKASINEFEDGIVIGGFSTHDGLRPCFVKTDLNGNLIWAKDYAPVNNGKISQITPAQDGGYYARLDDFQGRSARVIKIDANGNLAWQSSSTGDLATNRLHAIGEAEDGSGYYIGVSGRSHNYAGFSKLDVATGTFLWGYNMANALVDNNIYTTYQDIIRGHVPTQDGGILVSYKYSLKYSAPMFPYGSEEIEDRVLRFDSDGTLLWNQLSPKGLSNFQATSCTSDGGFILQRNTTDAIELIKANADGLFSPLCNNNYLPDISIADLRNYFYNRPLQAGENLAFLYDINNAGIVPFNQTYTIGVYLQPYSSNNPDQTEYFAGSFAVNGGSFGVRENNMGSIIIPDGPIGTYHILLRADDGNIITELNESNNDKRSLRVDIEGSVPQLPDMNLYDLNLSGASSMFTQGEILYFNFSIANEGIVNSGNFEIKSYLSTDQTLSADDYQDGIIATGNFEPDFAVDDVTGAMTIAADFPPGTYYLIVKADADDLVDEINELNNTKSYGIITVSENEGGPCPQIFPDATYLGEHNDHAYFISNNKNTWQMAQAQANANGGYLASFGDEAEMQFVRNNISEIVFIGLYDASPGNFDYHWDSGEPFSYNFTENISNATARYGRMNFWEGSWAFDGPFAQRKYIVELPCSAAATEDEDTEDRNFNSIHTDAFVVENPYPNPASDHISFGIKSEVAETVMVQIYDTMGKEVSSRRESLVAGKNEFRFRITDLHYGLYFLRVTRENGKVVSKRFLRHDW